MKLPMKRHTPHTMPARRHIPGSGSSPDMGVLETAKAGADAFAFGVDLFNHGFFWEAHEVWEAVWMTAAPNSARRQALRALIQMTNACLKLAMGKRNAFDRLAAEIAAISPGEGLAHEGLDMAAQTSAFVHFAADVVREGGGPNEPQAHGTFPYMVLWADQDSTAASM
jgi:uncharacterized protein